MLRSVPVRTEFLSAALGGRANSSTPKQRRGPQLLAGIAWPEWEVLLASSFVLLRPEVTPTPSIAKAPLRPRLVAAESRGFQKCDFGREAYWRRRHLCQARLLMPQTH